MDAFHTTTHIALHFLKLQSYQRQIKLQVPSYYDKHSASGRDFWNCIERVSLLSICSKGTAERVPLLYQGLNQNRNEEKSTESEKPCEVEAQAEMTRGRLSIRASPTSMSFLLDTGNPALNSTLDGVVKIAGVGVAHAASQEAYSLMRKGSLMCGLCGLGNDAETSTRQDFEKVVKKASKEGIQWGLVAGMYAGFGYAMEKVRGKHDWKNAALGGALTGAILSVSDARFNQDKIVRTAITASALAAASEFLKASLN